MRPSNVSVIYCVIAGWVTGSAAQKPLPCKYDLEGNLQILPGGCVPLPCKYDLEGNLDRALPQKHCSPPPPPPPPPQPEGVVSPDCSTTKAWSEELWLWKVKWCCENWRPPHALSKYCSPPPPPPPPCGEYYIACDSLPHQPAELAVACRPGTMILDLKRRCPPPPPPPPRASPANPCWKVRDVVITLRTPSPGPG